VKPCLLIPIYDHKEEIRGVVESLQFAELPLLIVDDGSDLETREVLKSIEQQYPWVRVHRREANGGRGAALKTGYRLALEHGYSHAVQLDADGQHDASDVPAFVAAIAEQPAALVLGVPQFDESAPRSRLYGRKLSIAMVWLATWSKAVEDPLCGFRAIPLQSTVALIDAVPMGDHMEFDPELIIRSCWHGIPIRNVPTRVVYRSGGLSHFDTVRDNVRLTRMYARAVGRMLLRAPFGRSLAPGEDAA
jgi:glycosyltransferase involved in cell wall biosynthesis